ncbi:MAG: PEGA domain-containing protein [Chitinivibrionales bacterium]|nr:PEGA domain-containing protein [Chitinivibrionales bacterium]
MRLQFHLCACLLAGVAFSGVCAPKTGFVSIKPRPSTSDIFVNGEKAGAGKLVLYEVPIGEVEIKVTAKDHDSWEETITVAVGEQKEIAPVLRSHFATIDVITDPIGAELYLNKKFVGHTPFSKSRFDPGYYLMKIELAGFKTIRKNFSLPKGDAAEFAFELEHTRAWHDSVAAYEERRRKKRRFIRQLAFGGVAAGFAGAGVFFNGRVQSELNHSRDAAQAYDGADAHFESYKEEYRTHRDNAQQQAVLRNVFYGLSLAGLTGFTVSLRY